MSQINNAQQYTVQEFIDSVFSTDRKAILFWDSCSLLEILRFPYRKGNVETYKVLNTIDRLIQTDKIYSVASSLTIKEWNEHEVTVSEEIDRSLTETDGYHSNCMNIINEIYGTGHISEPIQNKSMLTALQTLSDNIISKTKFIKSDEIAQNAVDRVSDKRPPASKKNEFKDCVVWESMLKLSRDIYSFDKINKQIFYTVNIHDFLDTSRTPRIFHGALLSEASMSNLACCSEISEVKIHLGL